MCRHKAENRLIKTLWRYVLITYKHDDLREYEVLL